MDGEETKRSTMEVYYDVRVARVDIIVIRFFFLECS